MSNKGRLYMMCPIHHKGRWSLYYGEKTCMKRLYYKPDNKLKAIKNFWICEDGGSIMISKTGKPEYGNRTEEHPEVIGVIKLK